MPDPDYDAWLAQRRMLRPPPELVARIVQALPEGTPEPAGRAQTSRWGIAIFASAAVLVFAVRLGLLLQIFAFPETSHPELAAETFPKEPRHESRMDIRS